MVGSIGDITERDHDAWMALLNQAVAAERERCAKKAKNLYDHQRQGIAGREWVYADDVEAAIRKGE